MNDYSHLYSEAELKELKGKAENNVYGRFNKELYENNQRVLGVPMIRKMLKSSADFHVWKVQSFYDDYEEDNESDENETSSDDEEEPAVVDPDEFMHRKRKQKEKDEQQNSDKKGLKNKNRQRTTQRKNFEYFMYKEKQWLDHCKKQQELLMRKLSN